MKKLLGAVLIIILLISNAYFFIQNQKLEKNIIASNSKISDLEKQIAETKNKPPQGWDIYTNEKYKFKMWYPTEITSKNSGILEVGGNESYSESEKNYNIFFAVAIPDEGSPTQIIDIYINNNNANIKEFIKNDITKWQPDIKEKYSDAEIISGIQQIKSENLDLYKFGDNGDYYLKKNDLIFTFKQGESVSFYDYQQIYETMVQSFHFID